jgi:predicted SprT family Zn-dependent metalloprotease
MPEPITPTEYRGFQKAYDFFNVELFGNSLPHVLVTLQRHAKAKGYFSPDRFTGRVKQKTTAHELALNPDQFTGCTDEEILSTLAHEMAHVWQQTSTGQPGGKETGQSVTHIIVPGGPYAKAYAKLKAAGFQLHWQSAPETKQAKAKKASKTKYTCPECGQNAWAKPDAVLICGECYEDGEGDVCLMLAEAE